MDAARPNSGSTRRAPPPCAEADPAGATVHRIADIPVGFWMAADLGLLADLKPGEIIEIRSDTDSGACRRLLDTILPGRFTVDHVALPGGLFRLSIGRRT